VEHILSKEDERIGLRDEFIDIPVDDPQSPEDGRKKIGKAQEENPFLPTEDLPEDKK